MKHRVLFAAAAAAAGFIALTGAVRKDDSIVWRTDVDAARTEARMSGKPLFVVFR